MIDFGKFFSPGLFARPRHAGRLFRDALRQCATNFVWMRESNSSVCKGFKDQNLPLLVCAKRTNRPGGGKSGVSNIMPFAW